MWGSARAAAVPGSPSRGPPLSPVGLFPLPGCSPEAQAERAAWEEGEAGCGKRGVGEAQKVAVGSGERDFHRRPRCRTW